MANDLRVELRARNNVLWHAIFDLHPTVADFCRVHGFEQTAIGALLNLSMNPVGARGWTKTARRLADVTGLSVEALFPLRLYEDDLPKRFVAELDSGRLVSLSAARMKALPASQDRVVIENEMKSALGECLGRLTPRQRGVLERRYGLDGGGERTYRQVGEELGVGGQRVRQIEAKALRHLRKPTQARGLRPFVDIEAVYA